VLTPRSRLVFAQSGGALYEELYELRHDLREVYRRLAYSLNGLWQANDTTVRSLLIAYRLGAAAMVIEILGLVVLVTGTLV
jgi:hypothetical protein